jgi:hypothetical protein
MVAPFIRQRWETAFLAVSLLVRPRRSRKIQRASISSDRGESARESDPDLTPFQSSLKASQAPIPRPRPSNRQGKTSGHVAAAKIPALITAHRRPAGRRDAQETDGKPNDKRVAGTSVRKSVMSSREWTTRATAPMKPTPITHAVQPRARSRPGRPVQGRGRRGRRRFKAERDYEGQRGKLKRYGMSSNAGALIQPMK